MAPFPERPEALLPEGARAPRSISFHLSLLVATVALPLIALAVGLLLWSAELSRGTVYDGLREAAHRAAAAVDRQLGNWASSLETLAAMPALQCDDLSAFYPAALQVAGQNDVWVVVMDRQGQQRLNTLRPFGAPLPRVDLPEPGAPGAFRIDRVMASDLVAGPVAGRAIIALAAPVVAKQRAACWIAFAMWPERFHAILAPLAGGSSSRTVLMDSRLRVVADSDRMTFAAEQAPDWFIEAAGGKARGIAHGHWPGAGEVLIAFERVNGGRWTLAIARSTQQLGFAWLAPVLAAGIGMLLILAASLLLARRRAAGMRGEVVRLVELARALGGPRPPAPRPAGSIAEACVLERALLRADRSMRAAQLEHEQRVAADSLRAAAESANRAKDRFLGMVSHELRTPLTAVLGWLDIAAGCAGENLLLRKALDTAKRNARQQQRIIEDLIDVSRIVSGKFTVQKVPLELASLVREAVDDCRPAAAEKGVALAARVETRGMVAADAGRMHQVLGNLIGNAIKFNPSGGWVLVSLAEDGDEIEMAVTDSGVGIEARALPHVFEQFWQAERPESERSHGLGLGLALVRHIVELHGGSVSAQSDGPGRGARFSVRLPKLRAALAPVRATPLLPQRAS